MLRLKHEETVVGVHVPTFVKQLQYKKKIYV